MRPGREEAAVAAEDEPAAWRALTEDDHGKAEHWDDHPRMASTSGVIFRGIWRRTFSGKWRTSHGACPPLRRLSWGGKRRRSSGVGRVVQGCGSCAEAFDDRDGQGGTADGAYLAAERPCARRFALCFLDCGTQGLGAQLADR